MVFGTTGFIEKGFTNVKTGYDYHRHTVYKSVQKQNLPVTNGPVQWAETTARVTPKTHQFEGDSAFFLMTYLYIEEDMATTCTGFGLATRGHTGKLSTYLTFPTPSWAATA